MHRMVSQSMMQPSRSDLAIGLVVNTEQSAVSRRKPRRRSVDPNGRRQWLNQQKAGMHSLTASYASSHIARLEVRAADLRLKKAKRAIARAEGEAGGVAAARSLPARGRTPLLCTQQWGGSGIARPSESARLAAPQNMPLPSAFAADPPVQQRAQFHSSQSQGRGRGAGREGGASKVLPHWQGLGAKAGQDAPMARRGFGADYDRSFSYSRASSRRSVTPGGPLGPRRLSPEKAKRGGPQRLGGGSSLSDLGYSGYRGLSGDSRDSLGLLSRSDLDLRGGESAEWADGGGQEGRERERDWERENRAPSAESELLDPERQVEVELGASGELILSDPRSPAVKLGMAERVRTGRAGPKPVPPGSEQEWSSIGRNPSRGFKPRNALRSRGSSRADCGQTHTGWSDEPLTRPRTPVSSAVEEFFAAAE